MIRGRRYVRLHSGTTCPWPVTDRAGVMRCVVRADRCKQHRHLHHRLVRAADYLWAIKPWWPNSAGEALDRRGRELAGLPQDVSRLHTLLVRVVDRCTDTPTTDEGGVSE